MNIEKYGNIINITYTSNKTNSTPLCLIKRDSRYWNGYEWIYDETYLKMDLIMDNIYFYNISSEDSLIISIADPFTHNILETQIVEFDKNYITEIITKGSSYLFKIKTDIADDVSIVKKINDIVESSALMTKLPENIFTYVMTFEEIGVYNIELIQNENILKIYTLTVIEFIPGTNKKYISHDTIRQDDGSDTRVVDEKGRYLYGAKVFAKNINTSEEFEATTNEKGEWGMEVTNGNYIFLFDSENYNQVSMERGVL